MFKIIYFRNLLALLGICLISCTLFASCNQVSISTEKKEYSLSTSVSPTDAGTINAPENKVFPEGTKVGLTAVANEEYNFDHWEGDETGTSPSISVLMDKQKSVIAHFKIKGEYMLVISTDPVEAGTTNPKTGMYKEGTKVSISATSRPGYKFDYWSGDVESTSNDSTVLMDSKKNIIAHFKPQYKLVVEIDPVGSGTLEPATEYYDFGDVAKVTVSPNVGYSFDHWGQGIGSGDPLSASQSLTITSNTHIVAYFNPNIIDVIEGQSKGFITVLGYGTKYLNSFDVNITSNRKTTIVVNVPIGTVFKPNFLGFGRMINTKPGVLAIDPGGSKRITLDAAQLDSMLIGSQGDVFTAINIGVPDDLKLVLNTKRFAESSFRVKQYAIWLITCGLQGGNIPIGSGNSYQSVTQNEWSQIFEIYRIAGIPDGKYISRQ